MGLSEDILAQAVTGVFGEEKAKPNLQALALGYELAPNPVWELPPPQFQTGERMLISGGQAVGAGTIAAGCRFLAAYPMTPGTPVMEFLAPRAERFGRDRRVTGGG